ncbi:AMP-binding protein [Pseudonocardia petroleophila]|uniref:AMP-binding protein n=1 Tax=Pseudonocardia petroleophila TaxID=37331 RepID=A0A7G7MCR9_9PSEU|nr:AMP-binding protein [Pseudonocardia petroleophila]
MHVLVDPRVGHEVGRVDRDAQVLAQHAQPRAVVGGGPLRRLGRAEPLDDGARLGDLDGLVERDRPDPGPRHGVTDLTIVGDAFALRLLDALDAAAAAGRPAAVGSLRRIRSIGAVWSPPVKRRLLAHADVVLLDTIAASEGGVYAVSAVTRATADDQAGTFTLAAGARLIDADGRDVPPGSDEVGLLAAPVVAGAGYEGDPEKTAGAFRDIDGVRWSVPGDMARLDADGRLRLLGRGSQVINTGGEKVYADEVELVLRDHPAVRDAVVLGVPDPRWGSAVAAVVSLRAGRSAAPAELGAFVAGRLAGYKKPRRVVVVDEVARLNTGKADLGWARSQFAAPAPERPAVAR